MIVGSKYRETSGLTLTEVAKLIRADLKAAQKSGGLDAALRFSVRTEYYSGGGSINLSIKGYTGRLMAPDTYGRTTWTQGARDVAGRVRVVVDAYQRDNSDVLSDYSDVRFYGRVGFEQLPGMSCG